MLTALLDLVLACDQLLAYGSIVVAPLYPGCISGAFPYHKLPLAYLRESLLVLHWQLLFQGGVKFPTGGKSGGAKGAPWRR